MNFADTNWLAAMFFEVEGRSDTVRRFLRSHSGQLAVSEIVMLEAENVFRRNTEDDAPSQLEEFHADHRFYRDAMNWSLVRREAQDLFKRYARKSKLGTFDMALLASAKLSGITRLLSFDEGLKAVAVAERIEVFPPLNDEGKARLAELR